MIVLCWILIGIYSLAFILGVFIASFSYGFLKNEWHYVKNGLYNIPLRKILFTFDFGVVFSYWVIGWLFGNRSKADIKNIRDRATMKKRISHLEKENDSLKKEAINMATEIHLLANDSKTLLDAINEE